MRLQCDPHLIRTQSNREGVGRQCWGERLIHRRSNQDLSNHLATKSRSRGHFWSKRARPGQFWSKRSWLAASKTWPVAPKTWSTAPKTWPATPKTWRLPRNQIPFAPLHLPPPQKVSGKLFQEIE